MIGPALLLTFVFGYLGTLAISWPEDADDMPGGGWPVVYLRPMFWPLMAVIVLLGALLGAKPPERQP